MRAIKFRSWDKERKFMHLIFDSTKQTEWYLPNLHDRYEIMQFTGLHDKNRTEIYEGDIIQYDNERYEVYWSEDWAMYTVKGCQVQALMRYASYGEIIGNVWENADIIESTESA